MGKRKGLTYWNIPVPKPLNEAVEKAIEVDMHVSKSDFVRDAVREKLKRMGFSSTGELVQSNLEIKEVKMEDE